MGIRHIEDRRAFLAQLLTVGGVAVVGCSKCARSPTTAREEPRAERDDPYGFEVLAEPIVLGDGAVLADHSFVLSAALRSDAVIEVSGSGVAVRDLRILGPGRGVSESTVGLRIESARDVTVERVSIDGLPGAGISGRGIEGGLFRDISIRHCSGGIELHRHAANRALRLERVHADHLWPADPNLGRNGDRITAHGLALASLRDSVVVDCTAIGELQGSFSLTNPRRVRIQGARAATLAIRGTEHSQPAADEEPANEIMVEDCFFDKGLGYGASTFAASCVTLSQNIESIEIRSSVLNGAGQDGHGIELSHNVRARVVDCLIRGFNGMHRGRPAHAIELSGGSVVNGDFERVNQLVDQARIRADRSPASR